MRSPVKRVGRGLQLRLRHDAQQTDAGAGQLGQGGEVLNLGVLHFGVRLVGGVNDAHGPAHDGNRDAEGGKAALGPVAKLGTCIEMVAVPEDLHLRPPGGGTTVRRVDTARRRLPVGADSGHTDEMGVAVVRQQELDGCVGHDGGERPLNHVDDLGLTLGHVERVGQPTLETLTLALELPGDALAVGDLDRLAQLVCERPHLVVGLALLAITDDDEQVDQREEAGHEDPRRHGIAGDARSDRPADGHRGDREKAQDDKPGQRADEAKALGLRHLSVPFLFGDHAHAPFFALRAAAGAIRHGALRL